MGDGLLAPSIAHPPVFPLFNLARKGTGSTLGLGFWDPGYRHRRCSSSTSMVCCDLNYPILVRLHQQPISFLVGLTRWLGLGGLAPVFFVSLWPSP
uniref:Uncharacterized protein n=1 Tax=Arundo donax TaxID=35708 RepID=A0A0A9FJG7_ARUDO